VFRINRDAKGGSGMTQFGRALAELNIEIICANPLFSLRPAPDEAITGRRAPRVPKTSTALDDNSSAPYSVAVKK
jgi:hypothetical protein